MIKGVISVSYGTRVFAAMELYHCVVLVAMGWAICRDKVASEQSMHISWAN